MGLEICGIDKLCVVCVKLTGGLTQVVLKANLRERNLGDLQGFTRTEARTAVPEAFKAFTSSDENLPIPVGLTVPSITVHALAFEASIILWWVAFVVFITPQLGV